MKRLLFILLTCIILISCSDSEQPPNAEFPVNNESTEHQNLIYDDGTFAAFRIEDEVYLTKNGENYAVYADAQVFHPVNHYGAVSDKLVLLSLNSSNGYDIILLDSDSPVVMETVNQAIFCEDYLITDNSVFNGEFKRIFNISTYTGWNASDFVCDFSENVLNITCKNAENQLVEFHYYPDMDVPNSFPDEAIVYDDQFCYILPSKEVLFIFVNRVDPGYFTVTCRPSKEFSFQFGEYSVLVSDQYYAVMDDDKVVKTFVSPHAYAAGEMLVISDGVVNPYYTILRSDLSPLSDSKYVTFTQLSDGRYIAHPVNHNCYFIYNSDGSLDYQSQDYAMLYHVGDNFVLSRDADDQLLLHDISGNLLAIFGIITDDVHYHPMLSGHYTKTDYPSGYYFVFEDPTRTDKSGNVASIEYYYTDDGKSGKLESFSSFAYAKPVLYLYPEVTSELSITFTYPERLIVDYPAYNDGWHVTAEPDGTLTDSRGREYYALYWEESSSALSYDFTDGFCISGENSADFLESALTFLGLSTREANEFIIYWLPILEASPWNLIRFEMTDEREAASPIEISPAPDSLLRIAMHVLQLDEPRPIPEQTLPTFSRNGFVAVEWGGVLH